MRRCRVCRVGVLWENNQCDNCGRMFEGGRMEVGDVVVPKTGPFSGQLCCGSGIYTHAICVSVDPFVMVSEQGDMMWSCQQVDDFVGLCKAHPDATTRAFERYRRERGP